MLFATFVILYALSQIDIAKFKDLKTSLREAFSHSPTILKGDAGVLKKGGQNIFDSGGFLDTRNLIPPILDAIAAKEEEKNYGLLQEEFKLNKIDELKGVKTNVTERGLTINLVGNLFFESSATGLRKESRETLKLIGEILKKKFPYNLIRVEGHTDNLPINSSVYPSNWELSAFRAASVARYFIENTGMEKDRFVVVGYSDSRPIASNNTKKGRKTNRRVEIVILKSKLIKIELQTYKFQKERLKRLKEIAELYKKKSEEEKDLSDAAKKLMNKSSDSLKQLIFYGDDYQKKSNEMLEQIKEYETKNDPKIKNKLFFNSLKKEFKHKKDK